MIKHPATYTESFIPKFAELLIGCETVLDPFGGVGKLALIKDYGFTGKVVCNELEREWAEIGKYNVDEWHIGDAANMTWAKSNSFDAICTSPTYGNRMADHHNAKDASKRITYRHCLGRPLNQENTGKMQWGEKYKKKHDEIYKECLRVLKPNGLMIVNVSDHIRKGQVVNVVDWHKETLIMLGLEIIDEMQIETPRMGFGQNAKSRVQYENILVFKYFAKPVLCAVSRNYLNIGDFVETNDGIIHEVVKLEFKEFYNGENMIKKNEIKQIYVSANCT